ncbi:MAG: hypothetical protein INQ03_10750 [Candidatus Heimdallarchaeota archaeon]|nr:hypothetical protein [Candidatus Heimdallarchaeota archaeon]
MNWEMIVGIGLYFVLTVILYVKEIKVLGIKFFPFGISTSLLNTWFVKVGEDYKHFWIKLGDISRVIFGLGSIIMLPAIIILITLNSIFKHQLYYFTLFILDTFLDFDYDSVHFWVIVLIAIIAHELFHGFQAAANELKIRSSGLFVIPSFLYAGYVNIDFELTERFDALKKRWNEEAQHHDVKPEEKEAYDRIQFTWSKIHDRLTRNLKSNVNKKNPFLENTPENFVKLGRTVSFGLFANLIILILSILMYFTLNVGGFWQITINTTIGVNIFLIIFNLLPIVLSDGRKLLTIQLNRFLDENKMKVADNILSYISMAIVFLIIF